MALKSSDKIIAIVGIIILIIAGIAIFLYSSPQEDVQVIKKEKTFTYTWVANEENMTFTDYAAKKKQYQADIEIDLSEGKVLTAVNFWIRWKDDYTRGIFINKGEDKLTATLSFLNEEIPHSSKKSADEPFADFTINDIPQDEVFSTVEENFDPAEYIKQKYIGQNAATFNLSLKVVTGEKLLTIRPLKLLNFLLDKGNEFNLIITYEYYDYNFEEQEDNIPTTGFQDDDGDVYSHMTNTGFK